ncbi:hypothetical protein Y032_0636g926, partial [Ancylostoma ceylanicum]
MASECEYKRQATNLIKRYFRLADQGRSDEQTAALENLLEKIIYISKRYEWKSRVEESQLSKDVSSGILDLSAPSGSKLIQKQRRPCN